MEKEKTNHKYFFFRELARELAQPFIDLFKAPRALFGLNLIYMVEGLTYFGILGLLALFYNDYLNLNDIDAGHTVTFLTAGITISMLFLGGVVDKIGLRKSLLISLLFLIIGRVVLTLSPDLGGPGMWGGAYFISLLGMVGIIIGYGIFQPAAYAGVKQLTTEKTSAMGYAMLYAIMNLGGFLPGLMSPPIRKAVGMKGVFWVYVALTVAGFFLVAFIITKKAMNEAVEKMKENEMEKETPLQEETAEDVIIIDETMSFGDKIRSYFSHYLTPLKDPRFMYFIFILIPVQTLFAHNWLTIPQYTSRAFDGFIQENFEFFVNLNPIMIFVLTPMVTALTAKKNTYNMMIIGTLVMAFPTFILAAGPTMSNLMLYLVIMTIGEAMWQPRFLQWVAEIAPKNMTGIYMGIGQFPWFMTKVITGLYSGWFLMHYCPPDTPQSQMNTEAMWLIYGFIAVVSPIGLIIAKGWMKKGFKETA